MKRILLSNFFILFSITVFSQSWEELNAEMENYYAKGDFEKATILAKRAADAALRDSGEMHSNYTASLNNLGVIYNETGKFELAEPLFIKALDILKKLSGEDADYASVMNSLALTYYRTGNFVKAENLYLKTIEIQKRLLGENAEDFGISSNNLALLYQELGQYEKALPLFTKAIEVFKITLGENSPFYISAVANVADLYMKIGRKDTAEILLLRAKELRRQTVGEEHPLYANILNTLGALYRDIGQFEKAEVLYTQAMNIREKKLGTTHFSYATSLNNLGILYKDMNRYDKAGPLLAKASEITLSSLGYRHPNYTLFLNNMADYYAVMSITDSAEKLYARYKDIEIENIRFNFNILSEKEKGNYLKNKNTTVESVNSFLFLNRNISSSFIDGNFNLQLLIKSLTLSETKNLLESLRNSTDSATRELFYDWLTSKRALAKQYSLPVKNRIISLDSLEQRTESLEKMLVKNSALFNRQKISADISATDVKKNLSEHEAVVEFVRFRLVRQGKWRDSTMYAAYVLRKNDSVPVFVPLFEEYQLQKILNSAGTTTSMVSSFYRGTELKSKSSAAALGKELYKLIWEPLNTYLKGIKKISYSPAGKLFNIAFDVLPADSNLVLMDKYYLQQYTNTRLIALRDENNKTVKPQSITLFGDASFTMDSTSLVKQKTNTENISNNIYTLLNRGTRGGIWVNLPGTANEVKKISTLFFQNKVGTKTFTQTTATEENLKSLSGNSPQVLHIATHGFFLPEPDKKRKENPYSSDNTYTLADDPLLRSGLIFAGGNYAWSGKTPIEGVEDGIATAYEISQLDLSNTELVVLSACETALGDVKGSEGVFGLQRAFKMAGVKKMIVSLWQVPDKETAELMTAFYTYWLKGKTIEEAFAQAQAEMRKKYPPFYWAAFVLVE